MKRDKSISKIDEDKFQLEGEISSTSELLQSLKGPLTIALNGRFGDGKTSYLNILKNSIKGDKEDVLIIEIDAWKSDYMGAPFADIIGALKASIGDINGGQTFSNLLTNSKEILKYISNKVINITSATFTGIPLDVKLDSLIDNQIDSYKKRVESLAFFQESLTEFAKAHYEKTANPILIFVDELDRCKPSYTIEFLESLKHFFEVEGIVFLLAIDRQQIESTVKVMFGNTIDAEGYLSKFIDVDLYLPKKDNSLFIRSELQRVNIPYSQYIEELIGAIIATGEFSKRKIKQAMSLIGAKKDNSSPLFTMFWIYLNSKYPEIYAKATNNIAGLTHIDSLKLLEDYREVAALEYLRRQQSIVPQIILLGIQSEDIYDELGHIVLEKIRKVYPCDEYRYPLKPSYQNNTTAKNALSSVFGFAFR